MLIKIIYNYTVVTITLHLQEEKSAVTTKFEELDTELLEKNCQLKIDDDKVVKLQKENQELMQNQKVRFNYITVDCTNIL